MVARLQIDDMFQSTPLANERRKDAITTKQEEHNVSIHSSREREEKVEEMRIYYDHQVFQSTPLANERRKPALKNRSSFNGFDIHFRGLWRLFIFSG